jgi:hypothetical protein
VIQSTGITFLTGGGSAKAKGDGRESARPAGGKSVGLKDMGNPNGTAPAGNAQPAEADVQDDNLPF